MKRRALAALGCCSLMAIAACASTGSRHASRHHSYRNRAVAVHPSYRNLLSQLHFDLPVTVNDRVMAWIDYFTGPNRDRFERYLQRSGRYMSLFRQVLRQYGLPQDLVYVALIESGFSNRATSWASAAGTWQFIQSTGRRYGLGINTWIDQRRDPERAVDAAARYLRDLHREFGDWYLAMAGYNAGEGRVREAVARYGSKDFWELSAPGTNVFRAETRDYVPKFLAAAIIAKAPEQFGFRNVQYQAPWSYERARVDSQTDLTPPGAHEIRLPIGTVKKFQVAFAKVPRDERVRMAYHEVGKHDTLPRIARRYGVSVRELMAANSLKNAKALRRGQQLLIPRGRGHHATPTVEVAQASTRMRRAGVREGAAATYRVLRGDTLAAIAAQYGVTVADLRAWNGLGNRSHIVRGQRLRIAANDSQPREGLSERLTVAGAPPQESPTTAGTESQGAPNAEATTAEGNNAQTETNDTTYTVKQGDSWAKLAQQHGVSIKALKALNPQHAHGALKIGQRLQVEPAAAMAAQPTATETAPESGAAEPASPLPTAPTTADESAARQAISQAPLTSSDRLAMAPASPPTIRSQLPAPRATRPATAKGPQRLVHRVLAGDTIWDLSRLYKVTPEQIKSWNNLSRSTLQPGQRLTIHLAQSRRS
ncbi:MAG: LysM peptidoglycan-binding domain-containing protein [Deltaproteobacteria bacterium]|nr:LysM peptidoglycan-binding domain-containing protein [Deltaproteobacteria bacterium]